MKDVVKKYWQGLESRERLILSVGGILVLLILVYAFVWQPWHKSLSSMKKEIQPLRSDLVWIRQHAEIIKNGGQTKSLRIGCIDLCIESIDLCHGCQISA